MLRLRSTFALVIAGVAAVAVPAALDAHTFAVPTVSVTEGKPRELSFTVTPKQIAAASALFKVTNKGKQPHAFKVCKVASPTDVVNTCAGVGTKTLAPGATATLTVKFAASGKYEYLSSTAAQAAGGMKGQLTVTLPSSSASAGGSSPTTTTSSTGTKSGGGSSGGVVNGQAVDPACPAGTYVPTGPNAGDLDDDNEGGFPTDNDGCL